MKLRCAIIAAVILFAADLRAAEVVLTDKSDYYANIPGIECFVDADRSHTFEKVSAKDFTGFSPSTQSLPSFGFTRAAIWMRIKVTNRSERTGWIIEIMNVFIDTAELYSKDGGMLVSTRLVPFNERLMKSRYATFPLQINTGESREIYLKFVSEESIFIPATIKTAAARETEELFQYFIFGLFLGIAAIMLLYNLFTCINIRETAYLFYSLYLIFYLLWVIFLVGFGYQYILRDYPYLNIKAPPFVGGIFMIFLGFFLISFLDMKMRFRTLYHVWVPMILFLFAFLVVDPFLPHMSAAIIINIYSLIGMLLFLFSSAYALRKGFKPARYFLAAYLLFMGSMFIWAGRNLGFFPESYFTRYAMYIGSTFEIVLLSFALSDKMGIIKKEKDRAQQDLIEQQREALETKTRMADSFARFVPREFLEFLNRPGIVDVELGDQVQMNMSVLFSDIRSFTTLSESMSPQETFNFINSYLEKIGPIIRSHNGFIDKYIGDAIMALFPGDPGDAVDAALEMHRELARYNAQRARAGYRDIAVGVGIHTGSLILGTIGEKNRMETTVIADAVNLASRLEGLTKLYGASIIISEDLVHHMENQAAYRRRKLDRVIVKGKNEPMAIYEILDPGMSQSKVNAITDYERALDLYMNRRMDEACTLFRKIAGANRSDGAAVLFAARCERLLKNGLPEGWDGIERLDEK